MQSRLDAVKPRERMLVRIDVPAMAKIRSISLLVILAWLFVDRVDEKLLEVAPGMLDGCGSTG